jgi:8-oxo-dGTP pyrophosphatase MutT (NUDIX family)
VGVCSTEPAHGQPTKLGASGCRLRAGRAKPERVPLETLADLLRAYGTADAREAGFVQRMLELASSPRAAARDNFVPGHFTASAFVLDPARTAVLLVHHRKLGIWVQPGGHVDATDVDLRSAAEREVLEEVGVAVHAAFADGERIFDVDVHPIPARREELAHEHFDVRFAFEALSRELVVNDEVVDARWVQLAEVERVTSDASVLRAVEKLRTRLRLGSE